MDPSMTLTPVTPSDVQCARCGGYVDTLWHERFDADGERVCKDCNTQVKCEGCGEWVEKDDSREGTDGKDYCDSCWGDTFTTCHHCDETIWLDDANCADDEQYCDGCFDRYFTECSDCRETLRRDSRDCYTSEGGDDYCQACYYDRFSNCDGCGSEVCTDDLICSDRGSYCEGCAPDRETWEPESATSRGPTDRVGSARCYGVELETSSCDDHADFAGDQHWGCKHDCSVDGEEFYSAILRGNDGLDAVDRLCHFAERNGWGVNRACGFHLHLDMRNESDGSLRAIACAYRLTSEVWGAFVASARLRNQYCCPIVWGVNELANATTFRAFSFAYERYTWVNLRAYTQHSTFEIRLHQGTLDAEEIRNWIRAHTTFADYASRAGGWAAVSREFDNLGTSEKFDKICAIWTAAGCADLVEYYADTVRASGRFLVNFNKKEEYATI